jgi:poly-gamma-glutamate capsule biosynthesis protein CapA/YwtB (metallophosphatase superfamily)
MADDTTLFLCGDVMLGRGIDQLLPHPGEPTLHEAVVRDARRYIDLAEQASGPIRRPVDPAWPWGEALAVLDDAAPAVRVVNLETSVTRSDEFSPGKAVHYRMHPANLPALTAARPDVCVLANNHVLDFGRPGLEETLGALSGAGLRFAGAGRDLDEAMRPAVVELGDGRHVLVLAVGMASSGIPAGWAATADRSGVAFLPEAGVDAADALADHVDRHRRPGDLVVVSIHWGSNWGYEVPRSQIDFAHRLVDRGVAVVHGHSSHHPRPVEVYRGRLILYGCGDLVDDYEGITGYERYRDDLRLLYLVSLAPDGLLEQLRMVPLQARRMRLERAPEDDVRWLQDTLDRVSGPFGTRVALRPDDELVVRPS